ncbi:MAG: glycosyltransferase family 4 protein [Candidatus Riflebacteria bacterium]|nr:glycosyltransferase family 4 protein [Candidatus Riflebacteria bacterium]
MKILLFSQYYWPDITAAAFRIRETAELFAQSGNEVTVITTLPHRGFAEGKTASDYSDDGKVRVIRAPIYPIENRSKFNFIAHYLSFMLRAIYHGIFSTGKFDIIIASSPPLFVAIAGYLTALVKGCPFALDIRDLWPDSAVTVGQISKNGYLYKIARLIEKFLYKSADIIFCVAKPMAEVISQSARKSKISIIYNAMLESMIPEASSNAFVRDSILHEDGVKSLNVVYAGNYGYCQNLELLVTADKVLHDRNNSRFRFHLFGDGAEGKMLREKAALSKTGNFFIHDPLEKKRVIEVMQNADFLFLQLKPDETMSKTIPSKVFDYLAVGKPIIFGIEGEGKTILEMSGGNIFFEPGNLDSLLEALNRAAADKEHIMKNAAINREIVKKEFTREKMAEKMLNKIRELLKKM